MSRIPPATARLVRQRARSRCEYCHLPEGTTQAPFEIEHVLPVKHGGGSTLENLAFSCFFCNRHKGTNLSGLHPKTRELTRLYNPRQDTWAAHFKFHGALIRGRTKIGTTTTAVLVMNDERMLSLRTRLMERGLW